MSRKVISILTLLAFVIFSISCYTSGARSYRTKEIRTNSDWQGKEFKKGEILWVIKKSGEYIEFSKENPGLIFQDKIVGNAIRMSRKVEIERSEVKKISRHSDGRIFEIVNKEGKTYQAVGMAKEEDDRVIIFTAYESSESVSIPLSEVKSLHIKMLDKLLTALGFVAGIGIVIFLLSELGKGMSDW